MRRVLRRLRATLGLPARGPEPDPQVAAICYRKEHGSPRFLLVRTSGRRWTFPKGGIDPVNSDRETAEAEALEEGGVRGVVASGPLTTYVHAKREPGWRAPRRIAVRAYLLEVTEAGEASERHREPRWFAPGEAKRALAEGREPEYAKELERVIDLAVRRLTL